MDYLGLEDVNLPFYRSEKICIGYLGEFLHLELYFYGLGYGLGCILGYGLGYGLGNGLGYGLGLGYWLECGLGLVAI